MMKGLKITILIMWLAAIATIILAPTGGMTQTETPLFKDYQVVEVQPFEVPLNAAAPDSAGRTIADEIVYQIRKYSHKYQLFDMVIMEGTHEVPPGKKVLVIQGTVNAYNPYEKSWAGSTCDVQCQFVDKSTGRVLLVLEKKKNWRIVSDDNILDIEEMSSQSQIGKYIAKFIYRNKVENR